MGKNKNFILGVGIDNLNKRETLEKIKKGYEQKPSFCQIVTVNPEFLVLAQKNKEFKKVLNTAQISVSDGIGVILAGQILGQPFKERITGVDLVEELTKWASKKSLTIGFLGGKDNIALKAAECLKKRYPNFKFFANEGVKNIRKEKERERRRIISIVADFKPQILFVAFGAPWQDLWIYKNKKHLGEVIAVGVGGAFDYFAGKIPRPPKFLQNLGLEWLFRLIVQPWRVRRQLSLLEFLFLVARERFFP